MLDVVGQIIQEWLQVIVEELFTRLTMWMSEETRLCEHDFAARQMMEK